MSVIVDHIKQSGLSISQLSFDAQISEPRLQDLMDGAEPSLGELRQLASAMKISVSDFSPISSVPSPVLRLFQQSMGQIKTSQRPAVELISQRIQSVLELLPSTEIPNWSKAFASRHETDFDAQQDAETFRHLFLSGDLTSPMLHLPLIAVEEMGVILLLIGQQRFDGASVVIDGIPFVVVSPRFPSKILYTLAHEIGHLVAHHQLGTDFAFFDAENATGRLQPKRNPTERYADAFASCLLLPTAGIGPALAKIREQHHLHEDQIGDIEILYLAQIFGVSFQVAAKRCEDLDLLPSGRDFLRVVNFSFFLSNRRSSTVFLHQA